MFDKFYSSSDLPSFGEQPTEELVAHVRTARTRGRVLDLGCGDGRNTFFLAAEGYDVTAVDNSEAGINKLVRIAHERGFNDRVNGIVADARDFVFPPMRFDLVVAITLLDHLPPSDIDPVLSEMIATLAPGGTALIQVHTVDDPGCSGAAAGEASELAAAVRHYFDHEELWRRLEGRLRIDGYSERIEYDTGHGRPHRHGFALARGTKSNPF